MAPVEAEASAEAVAAEPVVLPTRSCFTAQHRPSRELSRWPRAQGARRDSEAKLRAVARHRMVARATPLSGERFSDP